MRSIKNLLEVMLLNQNYFQFGLCSWASSLRCYGVITDEEYSILRHYIKYNRPNMFSSMKAFKASNSPYYWPCGDKGVRVKWIEKHIKLN